MYFLCEELNLRMLYLPRYCYFTARSTCGRCPTFRSSRLLTQTLTYAPSTSPVAPTKHAKMTPLSGPEGAQYSAQSLSLEPAVRWLLTLLKHTWLTVLLDHRCALDGANSSTLKAGGGERMDRSRSARPATWPPSAPSVRTWPKDRPRLTLRRERIIATTEFGDGTWCVGTGGSCPFAWK